MLAQWRRDKRLSRFGRWLLIALSFWQWEPLEVSAAMAETAYASERDASRGMIPLPKSVGSIVAFGDSITVGSGVPEADRWLNIVADTLGSRAPYNLGRSGTVLQNSADATGKPRRGNGRRRIASSLTGDKTAEFAIIAYGFNDARYVGNPSEFNVASFIRDYRAILDLLLADGYGPDQVVVVSPYFISDAGLAKGSKGFAGQTRQGFEAYVTASEQVAQEFGVYWADTYSPMMAAELSGERLIGRDKVHPNALGHHIIAKAVLSALRHPRQG